MAAMMPSGSGNPNNQTANPYEHYDDPGLEDDLIDPDDGTEPSMIFEIAQPTNKHIQPPSTTSTTRSAPPTAPP